MSVNDDVLSQVLSAKVGALRAGAGISSQQQSLIDDLAAELRARLRRSTPGMVARSADARIRRLADKIGGRVDSSLQDFVDQRLAQFQRQWSAQVGYDLNEPRKTPLAEVLGGSATDWLESAGVRAAKQAAIGVAENEDDGSLTEPLTTALARDVKSVARSGASAAHNAAVLSVARANSRAISGVMAIATLDNRTTLLCISRHGGAWDVASGEPLDFSTSDEEFPGRPPWHFNCRTTLVPVFAGFEPPSVKDADKWLTTPAGRQALGPRRVALWQEGLITRNQLVDQSGRPQLVEELV
jgi:hypothetical protein